MRTTLACLFAISLTSLVAGCHGGGTADMPDLSMATAARCTIAQVSQIVELGAIDPEAVVTPGIYVKRVVLAEARPA